MSGLGIFALVLGVLFLIGVGRAIQTYSFVRKGVRTRAKIVRRLDATVANPDISSQSAPVSRFVVELAGRDGRKRRVTLADAFGGSITDRLVAKDDTISVIYDSARPDLVRIDSPWTLYFIPVFLCLPAILCGLIIAYVWVRT